MLRRVIYISRSLTGPEPAAIDAIVAVSAKRNAENQLTGMLWADQGWFAQVIEGEASKVAATMERVRADSRHTDIEILLDRPVSSRQFGEWSMLRAGDDDASAHGTTFMIGFAVGERTASAKRLYDIVVATDS